MEKPGISTKDIYKQQNSHRSVLLGHRREVSGRREDSVDMSQAYAKCPVHMVTSIRHPPMQQLLQ